MERMPVSSKIDSDVVTILNQIMDEAPGTPIDLSAAPSTAGGELNPGQRGVYNNRLYWNINGTTYYIALTVT